jgi:hypothetical protein
MNASIAYTVSAWCLTNAQTRDAVLSRGGRAATGTALIDMPFVDERGKGLWGKP